MYALYSKNKPQSDALMASYGHAFFKVGEAGAGPGGHPGSPLRLSWPSGRTSSRPWGTTWTWLPTC